MTKGSAAARWRLEIGDLARRPPPGLDAPEQVRFTPDGAAVTFLHGPGLQRDLWRAELDSGELRRLAAPGDGAPTYSHAEELRRERTRTYAHGITRHAWAGPAERPVLLVAARDRWLVGIGSNPDLRPLQALRGAPEAYLAPDGRHVAFVSGGDVWVVGTEPDAVPRRITGDAEAGVRNGVAEYVAAEELNRHDGAWWSADGTQIAIARVDERHVEAVAIPHLGTSNQLEWHRCPRPGTPNAHVRLRLADLAAGELREVGLPMEPDDYLARVVAIPAGGFLVAVLPRAQHELRWVTVTRGGETVDGWTETGGTWVNLDEDTTALEDGRILRTTERSGFRHLEVRKPDGGVRQLTSGEWVVTRLVGVDAGRDEAVVIGTRDGATERHVYAVPLGGGRLTRISVEAGWHEATLSRDGDRWVDTWSTLHRAPAVAVRARADGAVVRELHRPSVDAESLGLPAPDLLELTAADGATPLHAAYYRAEGDAGPAPLVISAYGGPHSQRAINRWSLTVDLTAQLLAQRGMAVLVVDNRGTYNRGVAFEAPLRGGLGGVEVDDMAGAVRQLAKRGLADEMRVGIMGWSYGGYVVLRCMTTEPDLFRTGVAGAPVVDWTLYDSAYTERYLGDPRQAAEAYRASGIAGAIGRLSGRLLVIHGAIDENVQLRHTARLVVALTAAGRRCEIRLLPGERHAVRSAEALGHRSKATVAHLEAELRPGTAGRSRGDCGPPVAQESRVNDENMQSRSERQLMANVTESIDVNVPVRTAYNQWTQFEEFPRFMEGVKSVTQTDDASLHWVAEISGKEEEWEAKITEQHPDERVAWTSVTGATNAGVVTFHRIDDNTTRVTLQLEAEPEGVVENVGTALGFLDRRVKGDLERFKEYIESRGVESGAWRGEVEQQNVR